MTCSLFPEERKEPKTLKKTIKVKPKCAWRVTNASKTLSIVEFYNVLPALLCCQAAEAKHTTRLSTGAKFAQINMALFNKEKLTVKIIQLTKQMFYSNK